MSRNQNGQSPMFKQDHLSKSKNAVYLRQRRLLDDSFAERAVTNAKAIRNKKAHARIQAEAHSGAKARFGKAGRTFSASTITRLLYHVTKGRDAGDIAVREHLLVSDVVLALAQAQNSVATHIPLPN